MVIDVHWWPPHWCAGNTKHNITLKDSCVFATRSPYAMLLAITEVALLTKPHPRKRHLATFLYWSVQTNRFVKFRKRSLENTVQGSWWSVWKWLWMLSRFRSRSWIFNSPITASQLYRLTEKCHWYLAFPTLWEGPCHWYSLGDVCEDQWVAPGFQGEISWR